MAGDSKEDLPGKLKNNSFYSDFFYNTTKIVNLFKFRKNTLLYKEIRWLTKVKVLNRVFELKDESQKCFQETNKQDFAKCFEDDK